MSQWASRHPEAMAEIAAAPLPRQNDLLADAARGIAGREARRQREYVEQTDREIAADHVAAVEQFDAEIKADQAFDAEGKR